MEKWITIAAALALAGCTQEVEPNPDPIEPDQAVTPGIYDVTYEADGSMIRAVLTDTGAYRSYDERGVEVGRGTWSNIGQRTCFEPSDDEVPPVCYTDDPADEDGSFTATSDDGRKIFVKPVPDAIAGEDTKPIESAPAQE